MEIIDRVLEKEWGENMKESVDEIFEKVKKSDDFWQKFFNFIQSHFSQKQNERGSLYAKQPWDEMEIDELCVVMKMKVLRVMYGVDIEKRIDDIEDLIIYALYVRKRLEDLK